MRYDFSIVFEKDSMARYYECEGRQVLKVQFYCSQSKILS